MLVKGAPCVQGMDNKACAEIQNYLLPYGSLGPTGHDPYQPQSTGNGSHHWWFYSFEILKCVPRMQVVSSSWVPFESLWVHYIHIIMTTMASQITSLMVVYSIVYSEADQRKHQSSASLAFVWGIHRDRWIPRTKGQLRGKCFYLMTSSCLMDIWRRMRWFRNLCCVYTILTWNYRLWIHFLIGLYPWMQVA